MKHVEGPSRVMLVPRISLRCRSTALGPLICSILSLICKRKLGMNQLQSIAVKSTAVSMQLEAGMS